MPDPRSTSPSKLIQRYGASYYLATLFFDKKTARDTMQLYAMVRIPDQVVDGETQDSDNAGIEKSLKEHYLHASNKLNLMKNEREQAYDTRNIKDETRGESVELLHRVGIPKKRCMSFWKAMEQDTQVHRYQSYEQLREYMYGSAAVVGLMMTHVIGYDTTQQKRVYVTAQLLGEAMQMTNFLRDVKEDREVLGRIYMPEHSLAEYDLTHEDVVSFIERGYADHRWEEFMKAMIAHTRDLYRQGLEGIPLLHTGGRKAVYMAAELYSGILDRIERAKYNVFARSCRTNAWDKLRLGVRARWRRPQVCRNLDALMMEKRG